MPTCAGFQQLRVSSLTPHSRWLRVAPLPTPAQRRIMPTAPGSVGAMPRWRDCVPVAVIGCSWQYGSRQLGRSWLQPAPSCKPTGPSRISSNRGSTRPLSTICPGSRLDNQHHRSTERQAWCGHLRRVQPRRPTARLSTRLHACTSPTGASSYCPATQRSDRAARNHLPSPSLRPGHRSRTASPRLFSLLINPLGALKTNPAQRTYPAIVICLADPLPPAAASAYSGLVLLPYAFFGRPYLRFVAEAGSRVLCCKLGPQPLQLCAHPLSANRFSYQPTG